MSTPNEISQTGGEFPNDSELTQLFVDTTAWLRENSAHKPVAVEKYEDGLPVSEGEETYISDIPGNKLFQLLPDEVEVLGIDVVQGISIEFGLEHLSRGDEYDPLRYHYYPDVLSFIIYKPDGSDLEQETIVLVGSLSGAENSVYVIRDKIKRHGAFLEALNEIESSYGFTASGAVDRTSFFENLKKLEKDNSLTKAEFDALQRIVNSLGPLTRATNIVRAQIVQEDNSDSTS